MATSKYQLVVQQALTLPPQDQLRLIQQLAAELSQTQRPVQPRYLVYGEFRDTPGREFATEEDFKLAEWHPSEEDVYGE